MLPEITIGSLSIPLYGPLFMIGFVISVCSVAYLASGRGISVKSIIGAGVFSLVGIVIGAKFFYFLTMLPGIIRDFESYSKLLESDKLTAFDYAFGGMVFYGGLIGFCIGVYIYCRKSGIDFWALSDIFAPFLPFGHAFGRIGCFCAGCCYGVEYHGIFSVTFPYNPSEPELSAVPRLPVQLIEAGLNFICFGVLLYLLLKLRKQKKGFAKGRLLGIYLLYYIIIRFILEFFRGDEIRGSIGPLSTSQVISILLIPVAVILIKGRAGKQEKSLDERNAEK